MVVSEIYYYLEVINMVKRNIIVGFHSTELKRKCGIATHSFNLTRNLFGLDRFAGLRINALIKGYQEFMEGRVPWRKTNQKNPNVPNLLRAIKNDRDSFYATGLLERAEIVPLEYGLWEDKNERDFLIPFLKGLYKNNITNILIPHTVLEFPEEHNDPHNKTNPRKGDQYERVMKEALKYTDQVICMTPSAIDILINRYNAPRELLTHIDHGINKLDIHYNR